MQVLLIDFNALFYRAIFTPPPSYERGGELKTTFGLPVGGVYGTLRTIFHLIKKIDPDIVVACTETGNYYRRLIYPAYKDGRKNSLSDVNKLQRFYTHAALIELGIPVVSIPSYEADDVIATIVKQGLVLDNKKLHVGETNFSVATGDSDLLQLVEEGCNVYRYQRLPNVNRTDFMLYSSQEDVKKYTGVYPSQLKVKKALLGDKSDNIKGINKFGDKKADEFFSFYDSFESAKLDNFSKLSKAAQKLLLSGEDDYKFSLDLVTLQQIENFSLSLTRREVEEVPTIACGLLEMGSLKKSIQEVKYAQVDYTVLGDAKFG